MQKKYFFDDVFLSVIYMLFIVAAPFVSVVIQFCFDDRTMYLSYLIASISLAYDHVVIFRDNIGKRLWFEASISFVCLSAAVVIGLSKIMMILTQSSTIQVVPYGFWDILFISILGILVIINVVEFSLLLIHDYRLRYPKKILNQEQNLIAGAKYI